MKKRGEARLDYAVVLRQNDEFRRKSVGYFGSALLGKRLAAIEPDIVAAFFNVAAVRSVMTRGIYHGDASRVAEVYRSGACVDCGRGRGNADGRGRGDEAALHIDHYQCVFFHDCSFQIFVLYYNRTDRKIFQLSKTTKHMLRRFRVITALRRVSACYRVYSAAGG